MNKDINQPIVVEKPASITVLQSAIYALGTSTTSKSVHLSPRQAEAAFMYIRLLEDRNEKQAETIVDLAERLADLEPANPFEEVEI